MYLKDKKYDFQTQLRFWSFYYHVFDYLVKKGLEEALKKYPDPIVNYFNEWRNIDQKEE